MIDYKLEELVLYVDIERRNDDLSKTVAGILRPIAADLGAFAEFARRSCPSYTPHNFQHSLAVLNRIGSLLSASSRRKLTTVELFVLFLSAFFHDTGMSGDGSESAEVVRTRHAQLSAHLMKVFLHERVGLLSEHHARLAAVTAAVIECHELSWDEMVSRQDFGRRETVMRQEVRTAALMVLLRVGDLLDLDADRSPDLIRRWLPMLFADKTTRLHHDHHKHVTSYHVTPSEIRIAVECEQRLEHELWDMWLNRYLAQDILNANSYVFVEDLEFLRLPAPSIAIDRAESATYELWPLRFEIDEAGRIWDVVSRSIYTHEFDYLRELIQNAVDADLLRIYRDPKSEVLEPSPRSWRASAYTPTVLVAISASHGKVAVVDNGVGMGRKSLEGFLFKVAESGFDRRRSTRRFPFHAIAKFGIGFVSVLTRAERVVLDTRAWDHEEADGDGVGRRVTIAGRSRDAFVDIWDVPGHGTAIVLDLNARFDGARAIAYLMEQIRYPSVPIVILDVDGVAHLVESEQLKGRLPSKELSRLLAFEDMSQLGEIEGLAEKIIAMEKGTAPPKSRRGAFVSTTVRVLKGSPFDKAVSAPFAVVLDYYLGIQTMFKSLQPGQLANVLGIVWIPVSFVDYELGVEWQSIHGFLVDHGRVVQHIEHVYETVSEQQPLRDWIAMRDDLAHLNSETEQLTDLEGWEDDDEGSEPFSNGLMRERRSAVEEVYLTLAHSPKGLSYYQSWSTRSLLFMSNESEFPEGLRPFQDHPDPQEEDEEEGGTPLQQATTQARRADDQRAMMAIEEFLSKPKVQEGVFQDGIRVGVRLSELVPIGCMRGSVNLTAGARLVLNVTRHSIDETPSVLGVWSQQVGRVMCQRVAETILNNCDKLGLTVSQDSIWVSPADQGAGQLLRMSTVLARESISRAIKQANQGLSEPAEHP